MLEIIITVLIVLVAVYIMDLLAGMLVFKSIFVNKNYKEKIYNLLNSRDLIKSAHKSWTTISKPFNGGYISTVEPIIPLPQFLQHYYYSDGDEECFIGFWNFSLIKEIKFALDFSREFSDIPKSERTEMFNRYIEEIKNENQKN